VKSANGNVGADLLALTVLVCVRLLNYSSYDELE